MLGSFFVRREEGSMEDVVDFPRWWEPEFVGNF